MPADTLVEPAVSSCQHTVIAMLRAGLRSTSVILAGEFDRYNLTSIGSHTSLRLTEEVCDSIVFFKFNYSNTCTCLSLGGLRGGGDILCS